MMDLVKNKKILYLSVAGVLILGYIFLSIFFIRQNVADPESPDTLPSPTPVNIPTTERRTPLQKTSVGKTTAREIEKSGSVISKIERDGQVVYRMRSASPGKTDEIITRNEIVISERIDTFNKSAGTPPKLQVYRNLFGQPDVVLKEVSPLGKYISANVYATHGVTVFFNRHTGTVYQIHNYLPMTEEEYRRQYAEYIQPAPPYPQETFR
jgi:hypothetical protein